MAFTSRKRLILLVILGVMFGGSLVYSIISVRFAVMGTEKNEFEVLRYSLTDSIARDINGNLYITTATTDIGAAGAGVAGEKKPCPT